MEKRLCDDFGGIWGNHPDWPVEDWQHEVADDNTRAGYWGWVENAIEMAEFDRDELCDCDDRSWHGEDHDSACPLEGAK